MEPTNWKWKLKVDQRHENSSFFARRHQWKIMTSYATILFALPQYHCRGGSEKWLRKLIVLLDSLLFVSLWIICKYFQIFKNYMINNILKFVLCTLLEEKNTKVTINKYSCKFLRTKIRRYIVLLPFFKSVSSRIFNKKWQSSICKVFHEIYNKLRSHP